MAEAQIEAGIPAAQAWVLVGIPIAWAIARTLTAAAALFA
jgi:hypothetical protein